jgi:methylthioribose-1-phosphate isomerase
MRIQGQSRETVWETADGRAIEVIDQRRLPYELTTVRLGDVGAVADAIHSMVIRGAPLIGAVAAYGVCFAAESASDADIDPAVAVAGAQLRATRPTAVNLGWAVEFVIRQITAETTAAGKREAARRAARQIVSEERERSRRIGLVGLPLIEAIARKHNRPVNVLTHCNAGWLATIDFGTATAPIYAAHDRGIPVHVWVDETRPRNQGAALTAYELAEHGVPHTVIADNAGGHLMQRGQVDLVIVGADRVAANGDTANKIGTYLKALAANDCGVPFYVALPTSSFDLATADGSAIPIEERSPDEVRYLDGMGPTGPTRIRLVPETSPAANPAFDITPARLVTAFITEAGIFIPAEIAGVVTQLPSEFSTPADCSSG